MPCKLFIFYWLLTPKPALRRAITSLNFFNSLKFGNLPN